MHHVRLRAVERMGTPCDRRGVFGDLRIEVVVEPGVDSETSHALPEAPRPAVDPGRSDRTRCRAAQSVREAPSGSGVPRILNRGIIVEGEPENQAVVVPACAAKGPMMRIANIGVVESEMILGSVIGELQEGP